MPPPPAAPGSAVARPLMAEALEKFESMYCPEPNSGCWLWTKETRGGYGYFRMGGEAWRAHRLAWRLFVGPIPKDLFVCHHCDTPPCVNPAHLFVGTHRKNMQDMREKGRGTPKKTHCIRGHELTEANSYYRFQDKADRRYRRCLACLQMWSGI
jgi:hypothetical protein